MRAFVVSKGPEVQAKAAGGKGPDGARRNGHRPKLQEFLERWASRGAATGSAGGGAGSAFPPIRPGTLAGEALASLLPQQPPGGRLRPLSAPAPAPSGRLAAHGAAAAASAPPRFDPALLPDIVRVFSRASARLGFRTQLPTALAAYVAAAAGRGALDLSAYDASVCKALVLYLGDAEVANRDCLTEIRKALQPRWATLPPAELVELLVAMRRLNEADRLPAAGRPGACSSRLLRMLLDAEPSVAAMLGTTIGGGGGGGGDGQIASTAAAVGGGLPPGAPVRLARVYVSFYGTATSGHQYFGMAPMLLRTLGACVAALDPTDPRVTPADDLARLVAGLVGIVQMPGHELTEPLRRLAQAVVERAAELSQPARALLLELPPHHVALPPRLRELLQERGGDSGEAAPRAALAFLSMRKRA
ncbi:hypothetical protein GPECTOR_25g362 [Gonium pectorale]|uniref:Uncharacterized protein n=1 Tax=Gonium pectorale TaxID=33097 RepID=A0A150GG17_GONPE|nr:hypothetical protein GPECTOR_25g362 [Gonium pectorale]|eukprot:KXZ48778.1 hypothetical protein GPECTOR_25g362 [Gonium pectorale]